MRSEISHQSGSSHHNFEDSVPGEGPYNLLTCSGFFIVILRLSVVLFRKTSVAVLKKQVLTKKNNDYRHGAIQCSGYAKLIKYANLLYN